VAASTQKRWPTGKRRSELEAAISPIFCEDFAGRVLPFNSEAADAHATVAAVRRQMGRPISHFDAQIAAIALSRGASVAMWNVGDFRDVGVRLINLWEI